MWSAVRCYSWGEDEQAQEDDSRGDLAYSLTQREWVRAYRR